MSKNNIELASEIVSAMHDELYKVYYMKKDFTKPFGQYVAEQYELIYNGINDAVSKRYK